MLDGLNVGDYMLSVWSRTALLHRGECVAKGTCTSDDRIEVPFKVLPDPAWHWHVEAPLQGEPSPDADVGGVSPTPGADVAGVSPSPGADVAPASPVPAQMWAG